LKINRGEAEVASNVELAAFKGETTTTVSAE
jgi:hypothetical protein